jgi:hypothetical protein
MRLREVCREASDREGEVGREDTIPRRDELWCGVRCLCGLKGGEGYM